MMRFLAIIYKFTIITCGCLAFPIFVGAQYNILGMMTGVTILLFAIVCILVYFLAVNYLEETDTEFNA